ncbi:outer membrane receptor protein [Alkalilimnicola ehrlichii]|uniref:Outer membrane receptor protein n=2 Tax=Alkalilimnicola ehrlichii TaxID=351052 RepID=A0A3E0WLP1_9GAMM|nr:TonB-dependent receptor [Alkalilimnicola ehrlichii]RFA26786.1 outer membrane receptor protein [Alkalilimnicola ehrlichii]RFA33880.1 outer membrane receptor protein [Alkalilimnicola ehrlichii]
MTGKHCFPLLLLGLCSFSLSAQTPDSPQALDTVVVTASSAAQTLRDAPASISVITREDIEARPVQELAELLGTVEGITLSRSGNSVPGVQIRGFDQSYTLMLIDGKRVDSTNVMFRGNDYDTGWLPIAEIERIEVVRGPMSSLYGSDAIGGVINIITRRVGDRWRGSVKLDAVRQERSAAGDTRAASVSLSGPLIPNVLGLRLGAGYDQRKADGAVNEATEDNGTALPGFPRIENRHLSARLSWTPTESHEVDLDHSRSERDHRGFELTREATSLRHAGDFDFGHTDITLSYDSTRNLTGAVGGGENPNRATDIAATGKATLPLNLFDQLLTVGGELRREELRDPTNLAGMPGVPGHSDNPEARVNHYAIFIEDEVWLHDRLMLTLGTRLDHHEHYGSHNSPRIYAVYHLTPSMSLKGGWARAFRAPTLLQNSPNWGSVSCGSPTVGCYIIGNRDLDPETSTSKELGLQFDFGRWGGGLTVFDNTLKDMIDISSRTANPDLAPEFPNFVGFLPDGRPIFAYQNIASVETQGLESSLRWTLSPAWQLRANYTYTDAKNTSGDSDLPLTYRPRHTANANVDWRPTARWSAHATARYSGNQYISVPQNGQNRVQKSGYSVFDLSTAYRFAQHFTVRAGVLNLMDEGDNRELVSDFNEEGRRYFVSLTAEM